MSRIRSLELLFNVEQKHIKSKEDCVVLVLHCLLINEGLQCVGTGDEWPESNTWTYTELLPQGWNSNEELYSIRYSNKDASIRVLLKIVKAGHLLLVNAAKNADEVVSIDIPPANFVADDYSEYSNTYKDLESLAELFTKEILQKLAERPEKSKSPPGQARQQPVFQPTPGPARNPVPDLGGERDFRPVFPPPIGGADLDPFGHGRGGMFMDPSSFGVPARPPLPHFGIGGPGGLPRGAVPPGARFDPFRPPTNPDRPGPNPDYFSPDYDFI